MIRVKSTRLLGVPVPNLIMGNVPKRAGVSGNAMAMKADLTWDNVEFCRSQTGLPVIIKGILSSAQALEPERHGCAGVWLSNHGGRQLDNTPSAMTVLPRVANALKGRLPTIIDGGVYRGQDVFRAIALGASSPSSNSRSSCALRGWPSRLPISRPSLSVPFRANNRSR